MRFAHEVFSIFSLALLLTMAAACAGSQDPTDDDRLSMDECEESASACTGIVKNSSKEVVVVKGENNQRTYYQIKKIDDSDVENGIRKKEVMLVPLDREKLERQRDVPTVRARIYEWEKIDMPKTQTGKTNDGFRSRRKIQNIEIEEN